MLFTSQIMLAPEHILDSQRIVNYLQQRGFEVLIVEQFEDALEIDSVDAIISVPSEQTHLLYHNLAKLEQRPLLVWITDQYGELPDEEEEVADIILPNHPLYIERQLSLLLNWRIDIINNLTQEVLEQRQRNKEIELLKNAIVRNVSHELRTPLLQVKSAMSMIAEETQHANLTNYASNAMARLESIIQNITMLGSSLDFNPSPIILRDTAESAKRNLQRALGNNSQEDRIKLMIDNQLPPIMADRQGLSTVFRLLMENALKFSDAVVEIIAERDGNSAYIAVKDYGIGIPKDKWAYIFELFYQIDSSTTRRYGGTGIGLALVKLILEHHNSEIYVNSSPGQGSEFYFHLPLVNLSDIDQMP